MLRIRGFEIHPNYLDLSRQRALVEEVRSVVAQAPLFQPITPSGKTMSVRISAAGEFGWLSDRQGYRYSSTHPNGVAWPPIPPLVLDIWRDLTGLVQQPECCLINFYTDDARMGLHRDQDEAAFKWPVLSISLGDDALFRMGHSERGGKTESIWLHSGDVVLMGGDARLCYHGIDRIKSDTSPLLSKGGRINLTLRVVT
ncbi:alpha-ketoglutarate-dependent dioxygenase AlkB family protein [Sulfitobacter sp. SK012]|uniref:alpha-ketoglutarate-dependent dioxygenase AlkB family protein n=1 Tax=Sulfitobacter sp. SK012 TaxID=1389005 RepID=UPI0020C7553F|nr:alpha-ketoglutarate-dependent dioxygenase AlkB [Sulfitobacter sp. SK012]